jgi:hypothetical protein
MDDAPTDEHDPDPMEPVGDHPTGEEQAEENRELEPPA